ncbi:MAG: response regulator [Acidimicrobiales bacterium]
MADLSAGVQAPLQLLGVEDDPTDATWLELMLSNATVCTYELQIVPTMADAQTALAFGTFDCVLLDLSLPDTDGMESVRRVIDVAPAVPVVVFTGTNDQELGLEAIEAGAQDYLVKGQATGNTILRAARWAKARAAARLAPVGADGLDGLTEAWCVLDQDLAIMRVNDEFLRLFGLLETEAMGMPFSTVLPTDAAADAARVLRGVQTGAAPSVAFPILLYNRQGQGIRRVLVATRVSAAAPAPLFVLAAAPLRK